MKADVTALPIVNYSGPLEMRKPLIYEGRKYLDFCKNTPGIDIEQKWHKRTYPDGTKIAVRTICLIKGYPGVDMIDIFVPVPPGGRRIRIEEEEIKEEETVKYLLLVEMGVGVEKWEDGQYNHYPPLGVAVFEPQGVGYGSDNDSEVANLKFLKWIPDIGANSLDPLGIVGQETYRKGWVKGQGITQCKRVDQGFYAYYPVTLSGWTGYEQEEVTWLVGYSDIWTYEGDIKYVWWGNIDPGPPPAAECGYTWSNPYPTGAIDQVPDPADRHDLMGLFYHRQIGFNTEVYWWPREFNQTMEEVQQVNREGAVIRVAADDGGKYYNNWWDGTGGLTGLDALLGDELLTGTFTRLLSTWDYYWRYWGIVWGTLYLPVSDDTQNTFPYLDYPPHLQYWNEVMSPYFHNWENYAGGVYVKDRWNEFFIQGGDRLRPSLSFDSVRSGSIGARVAIPDGRFGAPRTDREKTLCQGNIGYQGSTYETRCDAGEVIVNCGGTDHFICNQEVLNLGSSWAYSKNADFYDYGIFTKKDTGIGEQGEVDATKVKPVYAYACAVTNEDDDITGFIFGMDIDGRHYRTEEYPLAEPTDTYDGYYEVAIPECADAKDPDDNPIACISRVRVGYKTDTTEEKTEDHYYEYKE